MKRSEFLREIREYLNNKLPEEEIDEVLYDYAEHFDVGQREGKSEEEICAELGSPGRIAQVILEDVDASTTNRPLNFAPLSSRIVAFLIDNTLAGLPMAMLVGPSVLALNASLILPILAAFSPLMALSYPVRTFAGTSDPSIVNVLGIASIIFFFLYHPASLVLLRGRTPGKLLMKLKVVRKDGSNIGAGYILSREILGRTVINAISFGLAGVVSFLWALFSVEHKTVHDEISGTRVVVDRRI